MAKELIRDARVYYDKYEITTDLQNIALDGGTNLQDQTVLLDTTEHMLSGTKTVGFAANGFFQHDGTSAINDILTAAQGTQDVLITVAPTNSGAENEVAFSFQSVQSALGRLGATVGDMAPVSVDASGSAGPLVGGRILQPATSAASATGNSTGIQIATTAATESGFASMHVIAATGTDPTLDVIVQSDDNSGFSSANNRITFTQATGTTTERLSVAGAITPDDYWRVNYTIGGTNTPTFTFIVTFGIGNTN